jgi:hypothetical protein
MTFDAKREAEKFLYEHTVGNPHPKYYEILAALLQSAIESGKRAAWAINPFVWAITFKVAEVRRG